MAVGRVLLLCAVGAMASLRVPEKPEYFNENRDWASSIHQRIWRDAEDHSTVVSSLGAELVETAVSHRRARRGIKKGDGHVITAFRHIRGKALMVATHIVRDISTRDCAVQCVHMQCRAWSHSNSTDQCRLLNIRAKFPAVPVLAPDSDFFEISPKTVGSLVFKIIFGGLTSHNINVHDSQITIVDDPEAPENVLTDYLGPLPITPPSIGPPTPAPGPSPPPSVPDPPILVPGPSPPVVDPPTSPPAVPPTDAPTAAPDLSYVFHFPDHCGSRPTFGLSDFERLLAPAGIETTRVVGGSPVGVGTYPWQGQIEIYSDTGYQHSCGGIVISDDLILTAAHCHIRNEMDYQVRVAQNDLGNTDDPGERVLAVENVYRHSGHRPDIKQGQRNDIAMMRLKFKRGEPHGLTFSDYVQPLCLPQQNTTLVVGQECQISGWGLVKANDPLGPQSVSRLLKGAVIEILDPALCYKAYGNRFDERLMICAGRKEGGVDTCSGDSGGPLSCRDGSGRWFAAGIVSFGWKCGAAGFPGAYTRVSAYLEFLHRTAAFLTGTPVL